MLKYLIFTAVLWSGIAGAGVDDDRSLYHECHRRVQNLGYGNQYWQDTCREMFDMAEPYLLKCSLWVKNGFPSANDKQACQIYCENNKNWGPWYDFEVPHDLKWIISEMKRRHDAGRCYEN